MNEWNLTVDSRGMKLRICEWGDPSSALIPTVILHGFLEQGAAWHNVATRLPGRVYAPDQRGFGLSDHVGSGGFYHFWDYVGDVDQLVTHLGGMVNLVGHSMGGTVACLYAGLRPDRVQRLVLVEGLGPPDGTDGFMDRARLFLDQRQNPPVHPRIDGPEDAVRRMRKWNPGLSEADAHRLASRILRPVKDDDVVRGEQGDLTWCWDAIHRGRSPQPFQAHLFKTCLAQITAAVLSIDGELSPFGVIDIDEREACVRHLHKTTITSAGHMIHHDAPVALASLIQTHLFEDN